MSIKLTLNGFLWQMLRPSAVEIPSCVYAKTIIIIVVIHTHIIYSPLMNIDRIFTEPRGKYSGTIHLDFKE